MVQALIGLRSLPRADATDALAVAITHGRHAAADRGAARAGRGKARAVIARLEGTLIERDGDRT